MENLKYQATIWWEKMIEDDKCDEMEKKHGIYGHDIGTTIEDIIEMYKSEIQERNLIN